MSRLRRFAEAQGTLLSPRPTLTIAPLRGRNSQRVFAGRWTLSRRFCRAGHCSLYGATTAPNAHSPRPIKNTGQQGQEEQGEFGDHGLLHAGVGLGGPASLGDAGAPFCRADDVLRFCTGRGRAGSHRAISISTGAGHRCGAPAPTRQACRAFHTGNGNRGEDARTTGNTRRDLMAETRSWLRPASPPAWAAGDCAEALGGSWTRRRRITGRRRLRPCRRLLAPCRRHHPAPSQACLAACCTPLLGCCGAGPGGVARRCRHSGTC